MYLLISDHLRWPGFLEHGDSPSRKDIGMPTSARFIASIAFSVACAWTAAPAVADLMPNGNPTDNSTPDPKWGSAQSTSNPFLSVLLIPNPASYRAPADCPWILPSLQNANQPYNKSATDIWKFVTGPALAGNFDLVDYEAWADDKPTIKLGPNSFGGTVATGAGGAGFVINYDPGVGDPARDTIHWVQAVDTNVPLGRATTIGQKLADGTTIYLDNSTGVDPYYGRLSGFKSANGTGFLDLSTRALVPGTLWEGQVFLTTEADTIKAGITTHTVTIYNGVWWGYQVVPEPASWISLCGGGVILLLRSAQLRRRASAA
jgi:hypothetical protein